MIFVSRIETRTSANDANPQVFHVNHGWCVRLVHREELNLQRKIPRKKFDYALLFSLI